MATYKSRRDKYYHRAKHEGYRSRAAYKLKQMQDKFNLIKPDSNVIDLGAAPGGWLQIANEYSSGTIIGVDLLEIEPIHGVQAIKADITLPETTGKIRSLLPDGLADLVMCDASPNLSGNWSYDHARSVDLAAIAMQMALELLDPVDGSFVTKIFQGELYNEYVRKLNNAFRYVRAYNPRASRKESAEIYLICRQPVGSPVPRPEMR